jgi:hypothetical protein
VNTLTLAYPFESGQRPFKVEMFEEEWAMEWERSCERFTENQFQERCSGNLGVQHNTIVTIDISPCDVSHHDDGPPCSFRTFCVDDVIGTCAASRVVALSNITTYRPLSRNLGIALIVYPSTSLLHCVSLQEPISPTTWSSPRHATRPRMVRPTTPRRCHRRVTSRINPRC